MECCPRSKEVCLHPEMVPRRWQSAHPLAVCCLPLGLLLPPHPPLGPLGLTPRSEPLVPPGNVQAGLAADRSHVSWPDWYQHRLGGPTSPQRVKQEEQKLHHLHTYCRIVRAWKMGDRLASRVG